MKVTPASEHPLTDDACRTSTGKTLQEWFAELDAKHGVGRRDAIQWIYDETGRGKDVWWPTTIWVLYEASKGVVNKKDGLAEGYHLCATKTVAASVADVYRGFTEAGHNSWLGCNPATEGAPFTDDAGNTGTWLRLRPGKDVRIAWRTAGTAHPSMVDAVFADKGGGKTGITVNHARVQSREEADGLRSAWLAALDALKKQLEG